MAGYKHFLGYWIYLGLKFWTDVLKSLISRGLIRVLIFVTDDFSVLKKSDQKALSGISSPVVPDSFSKQSQKDLSKRPYQR